MQLLNDKIALITGATRGIGRGLALKFAEQGAHVAFTYQSSVQKAEELEQTLQEKGVKAKGFQSDASDYKAAEQLINDVTKEFGGLEVVVNNAGITRDNLLMRMDETQWDEVIQTNLKSIFNVSKFAVKPLMKSRKGSLIHISSVAGVQGNPGQTNYAASKAGVIGFSKSLAKELGSRNIRSNVITPGFIQTEMTENVDEKVIKEWEQHIPLGRGGTPEEVAESAVFLASDMSSYVTGQTLSVCGGMAI